MPHPSSPPKPLRQAQAFQRDLARMLLVFVSVVVVDLCVVSVFSGKLRIWFPQWIDPDWATRPDAWVVYSQSYIAGIVMIPVLLRTIDREFLPDVKPLGRGLFWSAGLAVFGFVLWWKGGLMQEHDKQWEAMAFALLVVVLYGTAWAASDGIDRLVRVPAKVLMARLLVVLASFFLVMAIADPVVQVGVQRLPWSFGLIVEMVFFIPAGVACLVAQRRLTRRRGPATTPPPASEGARVESASV